MKDWNEQIKSALSRWSRSDRFEILDQQANPSISALQAEKILSEVSSAIPEDLVSFYSNCCDGCDFRFYFRIPMAKGQLFRKVLSKQLPRVVEGGFAIRPAKEIIGLKKEIAGIVDSLTRNSMKEVSSGAAKMAAVIDASIPLSMTDGSYYVLVGKNPVLRNGLYCIDYSMLFDPSFAEYLTPTLSDWLAFLEGNLYLGRSWSFFYDSKRSRLVGDPKLCDAIRSLTSIANDNEHTQSSVRNSRT